MMAQLWCMVILCWNTCICSTGNSFMSTV